MTRILLSLTFMSLSFLCLAAEDTQEGERYKKAMEHHNQTMARLRSTPGVVEIDHPDVIEFFNKSQGAVILMTKERHPAHPAMVKRQVLERNGQLAIETTSQSAGNRQALKDWIDRMTEEDEKAVTRKKQSGGR